MAHRFELGDMTELTPEQRDIIHDRLMEHLANGGVLAMRAYLEIVFDQGPPTLDQLAVGYRLPEGRGFDSSCQVTPIGPAFFEEIQTRGAITCFEAAMYHAACEQIFGREAWVSLQRPGPVAHAVVWYPLENRFFDATELLRRNA